jgi:hypothetical protein
MSTSWGTIKEINCLAIPKPAFEILVPYANFWRRHLPAESLPGINFPCQMTVLRECVECLSLSLSGRC